MEPCQPTLSAFEFKELKEAPKQESLVIGTQRRTTEIRSAYLGASNPNLT
jgi:hypothetical protein